MRPRPLPALCQRGGLEMGTPLLYVLVVDVLSEVVDAVIEVLFNLKTLDKALKI